MPLMFIFVLYKPLGYIRLPFFNINPYEAVLRNTALLFEVSNYQEFVPKLADVSIAAQLGNTYLVDKFSEDFKLIQKIYDPSMLDDTPIMNRPFLAAVHQTGLEDLNFMYVFDQRNTNFELASFLDGVKEAHIIESTFRQKKIYDLRFSKGKKISIACVNNLVIMGRYALIVEDAIDQLSSTRINLDPDWNFKKAQYAKGENADIRMMINFHQVPELLKGFIMPEMRSVVNRVKDLGKWISLDFSVDDDGINVAGNYLPNFKESIIGALRGTKDQSEERMTKIVPDNIALFSWFGTGDYTKFYQGWNKKKNSDFEKYFVPWLGSEMGFVFVEPFSADMQGEQFAIFETQKSSLAQHYLEKYGEQVGELESLDYQTYTIKQLMSNQLLEEYNIQNPYYTFIENYAIFGASKAAMKNWIDHYLTSQVLEQDDHFLKYRQKNKIKSNNFFYVRADHALPLIRPLVQKEFATILDEELESYKGINQFSFNVESKLFGYQINSFVEDDQKTEDQTAILWRTTLAREAIIPPAVLLNPKTGQHEILIQDKQHIVYLMNRGGDILWRKKLDQAILSNIYQVDYHDDGSAGFMFNTKNKIYLIDRKGKNLNHFPMRLKSPATNGMLVCDFTKRKEYRFFVACENQNIYGFDIDGQPLSGWNPKMNVGRVEYAMQHFQKNNKDYLMAMNTKGKLFVFKQNGDKRLNPRSFDSHFLSSPGYQLKEGANRIVATDAKGKIHVVNMEGAYFKLNLKSESRSPMQFLFSDIGGDDRKDYIGLSDQEINCYHYKDSKFTKMFTCQLEEKVDAFFEVSGLNHKKMLGTLCEEQAKINLINGQGESYKGFPLAGSTSFSIVDLYGNKKRILVVGNGNSVYAYQLDGVDLVDTESENTDESISEIPSDDSQTKVVKSSL